MELNFGRSTSWKLNIVDISFGRLAFIVASLVYLERISKKKVSFTIIKNYIIDDCIP